MKLSRTGKAPRGLGRWQVPCDSSRLTSLPHRSLPLFLQHIGPGSYALPSSINTQPGGSNVPFLSGAERILMDNPSTSGTTPGPGAYQAAKVRGQASLMIRRLPAFVPSQTECAASSARPSNAETQRRATFIQLRQPSTRCVSVLYPQALDASQKRRGESINYSAPFASCTARLHTDKTHRGMPGYVRSRTHRHTQRHTWRPCPVLDSAKPCAVQLRGSDHMQHTHQLDPTQTHEDRHKSASPH